jgi:hypothetical protein
LLLGGLLQKLVRETPGGLKLAVRTLDRADLLDERPQDLDDVPRALVMDNWSLKARLQAMEVPGEFPKAPKETPAA